MLTLFTRELDRSVSTSTVASYAYVKRRLRKNMISVLRHCRSNTYSVKSQHMLVKLLYTLNVDPTLPVFEFHRRVVSQLERTHRANGITTASQRGRPIQDELFYGNNVEEVLVAIDSDIDVLTVEAQWSKLKPVQPLSHPFDGTTMEALDGRMNTEGPSRAIVGVDIVALAHQYRVWYLRQKKADVAFFGTPMQFIFEYPLANALIDHVEIALINRLKALFDGRAPESFYNTWPMHLMDLDDKVDKYLLERVSHLLRRPIRYDDALVNIELVFAPNAFERTRLPRMLYTKQNTWAFILARKNVLALLAQLDFEGGGSRNLKDASTIRKSFKELNHNRELDSALGTEAAEAARLTFENDVLAYL